jgi:hypothetical protein
MKYLLILLVFLTGCATKPVPVTVKFPDPPGSLVMERCPDLQKLKDDIKLSDVTRTITINYATYYECVIKLDAWHSWYRIQKEIFEEAGR